MMRSHTITGAVAAAIAILAVGFLWMVNWDRDSSRSEQRAHQEASRVAATLAVEREMTALPPPDTPLHQAFEPLRIAARHGNAAAGCRLGMALLRCRRYNQDRVNLEQAKQMPADAVAKVDPGRLSAMFADLQARVSRNAALCADAPPDDAQAWRLLLEAALRGHA